MITTEAISTADAAFDDFLELPWRIYPGRFPWVPPLKQSLRAELSARNLFFRHGEVQPFVARSGTDVVGRAVAIVDNLLKGGDELGLVGYLEFQDDQEVFDALMSAAFEWLRRRGKKRVHGPMDLNIYHRYRVQLTGFETRPFYGEPRSPAYYAPRLAAAGFSPVAHWSSWDIPWDHLPAMAEAARSAAVAHSENLERYQIVPFDLEHFEQEARQLHPLLMTCFENNYGFSGIDEDEFVQAFAPARLLIDEACSKVIHEGRWVAFYYGFFDPSAAFLQMNGDATRLALLDQLRPHFTQCVLNTFGVHPDHRKGGIGPLILAKGCERATARGGDAIGALFIRWKTAFEVLGEPSRTYAMLTRDL